jgi:hypothetical protein
LNASFLSQDVVSTDVKLEKKFARTTWARGIIFGFPFHCKRFVVIFTGRSKVAFSEQKPFPEQDVLGRGHAAYAFTIMRQETRHR